MIVGPGMKENGATDTFIAENEISGNGNGWGCNVSKSDEFCIKTEEFCIKTEDFCILSEEFVRGRWWGTMF